MIAGLQRPSPERNPNLEVKIFGESTGQPVRFFLFGDLCDELIFAGEYQDQSCVAVLTGAFGVEQSGGYVEVSGFSGLEYLDDEVENALYRSIRKTTDKAIISEAPEPIVGFFVSERGSKGRIDPEMARVHFSLFNVPFQVAVVVDPDSDDFGVYARNPHGQFVSCEFRVVRFRASDESE